MPPPASDYHYPLIVLTCLIHMLTYGQMTVSTDFTDVLLNKTNSNYDDLVFMFGTELSFFYFSAIIVSLGIEYRATMICGYLIWLIGYCFSFGFFDGDFYSYRMSFAFFAGLGSGIMYWYTYKALLDNTVSDKVRFIEAGALSLFPALYGIFYNRTVATNWILLLIVYLPVGTVVIFVYLLYVTLEKKKQKRLNFFKFSLYTIEEDDERDDSDMQIKILSPAYLLGVTFLYTTNYLVAYQFLSLSLWVTLPGELLMLFGKLVYWVLSFQLKDLRPCWMFSASFFVTVSMAILPTTDVAYIIFGVFYGISNGVLMTMVYQMLSLSSEKAMSHSRKLPYLLLTSFFMGLGTFLGTIYAYQVHSNLQLASFGFSLLSTLCFSCTLGTRKIHREIDLSTLCPE